MTKNEGVAGKKTVRVFNSNGEQIGLTYPKRAAGLVKKGRARYVNGCDIRLDVSDVMIFTEDKKMDNNINVTLEKTEAVNKLYFNAREWSFNKDCEDNAGSRSFMQGPDGVISEAYTIGNWGWSWTEIVSKQLTLPKNTLHTFTFWLNGGENDRSDEVCRLEIFFNNDYDGRYTYNLNRSFIKPIKRCNGWELYEIPFRTGDNEYTQLKFIAQRAYMTVLTAQDVSSYKDLPESIDKFANIRPQRHNIIFGDDGWPTNTWYSTRKLEEQDKQQNNAGSLDSMSPPHNAPFNADIDSVRSGVEALRAQIAAMTGMDISSMAESIRQTIKESILSAGGDESDVEDIVSDAIESLEDSITDATEELSDRLEELSERLEELSEE